MKPVVDRLAQEYTGKIDFYVYGELNSDAEGSKLADERGVTAIPTMMIVGADGQELDRIIGSRPEDDMRSRLERALTP